MIYLRLSLSHPFNYYVRNEGRIFKLFKLFCVGPTGEYSEGEGGLRKFPNYFIIMMTDSVSGHSPGHFPPGLFPRVNKLK